MLLWAVIALLAQDPKAPSDVFKEVAPSVVAVRSLAVGGERSGSGVVLTKDGLILTSYAVVPKNAEDVRVYFYGAKMRPAEIVSQSAPDELTLIRVKTDKELRPLPIGASKSVKVGDAAYMIGNAHNSFINDDSPSMSAGIISGRYTLTSMRAGSTYMGEVLETTAAANFGMEGAPLLDREGRMIGFTTMNSDDHRWLTNAVPIDWVMGIVEKMKKDGGATGPAPEETGEGTVGLEVEAKDGKVVVKSVAPGSPADEAGLAAGTTIDSVGSIAVKTPEDFEKIARKLEPGAMLVLTIDLDGKKVRVKLTAVKKETK